MGLLDSLISTAASSMLGGDSKQGQAIELVTQLIQQNGGNVGGLLNQLQQGGLGDALQSWIGTGENANVDASQIQNALGGNLGEVASKLGLDSGAASDLLSQYLPQVVDMLTPNGNAADADGFGLDDIARIVMQNFLK
ncbi:YidB family protein [Kingella negevensis]|uniref:YidB family protein n=1 Tax=Kingella negevensis TaxID=1522312 RepID=UPI00050A27A2|nr:YidB family protein [Kingella negevensis]MDK4681142.1 YidB family protein [Kingella negevensis]MDK4683344.1 YidB family protein [Kingella negevensis]MDK4688197.1 YidB family protein [Kingella negevensis]MDK4691526.1 YidB family protein [Kingella negevensis]MDK4693323.1 YidB family protein [Kingella negevensis]